MSTGVPPVASTATCHSIRPSVQQPSPTEDCPVFGQVWVQQKMATFHSKMASCVVYECSTCSERFPRLTAPAFTECMHCSRDSKKRFSSRNGMDPGEVPPPLQGLTQVEWGVSGELGSAGMSLGSLCVVSLVCCGLVVVLCFVVVSSFLFSAGSLSVWCGS